MNNFEIPDDTSEHWDVVLSDEESSDWHFVPAAAKSKVGSSTNLPIPAPLLLPPPQPKKGGYALPVSQPLSVPKFRPPSKSSVAKPLPISSPAMPSVVLHSTSHMPVSNVCSSTTKCYGCFIDTPVSESEGQASEPDGVNANEVSISV